MGPFRAEQHIADAQADPEPQTWQVGTEPDPATGVLRPRSAYVWSDDGLCMLLVEERLDRDRLAMIECPGLPIQFNYVNNFLEHSFEDGTQVGVKFDTMKTSATIG
jgi:hypothetical protein